MYKLILFGILSFSAQTHAGNNPHDIYAAGTKVPYFVAGPDYYLSCEVISGVDNNSQEVIDNPNSFYYDTSKIEYKLKCPHRKKIVTYKGLPEGTMEDPQLVWRGQSIKTDDEVKVIVEKALAAKKKADIDEVQNSKNRSEVRRMMAEERESKVRKLGRLLLGR